MALRNNGQKRVFVESSGATYLRRLGQDHVWELWRPVSGLCEKNLLILDFLTEFFVVFFTFMFSVAERSGAQVDQFSFYYKAMLL